jgi:hypothetical protein
MPTDKQANTQITITGPDGLKVETTVAGLKWAAEYFRKHPNEIGSLADRIRKAEEMASKECGEAADANPH